MLTFSMIVTLVYRHLCLDWFPGFFCLSPSPNSLFHTVGQSDLLKFYTKVCLLQLKAPMFSQGPHHHTWGFTVWSWSHLPPLSSLLFRSSHTRFSRSLPPPGHRITHSLISSQSFTQCPLITEALPIPLSFNFFITLTTSSHVICMSVVALFPPEYKLLE